MRVENEYGGALWDDYQREDVPKLEDYLRKHSKGISTLAKFHIKKVHVSFYIFPFLFVNA
jgi:hypothetical protein